jgi:hypothetical protein
MCTQYRVTKTTNANNLEGSREVRMQNSAKQMKLIIASLSGFLFISPGTFARQSNQDLSTAALDRFRHEVQKCWSVPEEAGLTS